jgi:outer membrane protein OmpA-like peptidoglycan-associated protein
MRWAALALAMVATGAAAQEVRFVACPMYRDTDQGRKSGCWLARDPALGVTYDVSGATSLPDADYGVLVEGRVSGSAEACGGVVMDPVRVSVLDDMACVRRILPAEGYKGRKFALPKTVLKPLYLPAEPVAGPFSPRTFRLYFAYGSAFMTYQSTDYYMDEAARWLAAAKPRRIVVTGYAATKADIVSGRTLREPKALAEERAERTVRWLTRMGVDPKVILVRTSGRPEAVDDPVAGLPPSSLRRVEIEAEF